MIDPHVHLRDKNQSKKETIEHGLLVAYKAGLDGVFEMPNTDPALTNRDSIEERILIGHEAVTKNRIKIFHGIFAGVTDDPKQIEEAVSLYSIFFPNVVGLKMFAGHSTGNMGLINEEQQRIVYRILAKLDYRGVIAVHCEKEQLLKPGLWNYNNPFTHTIARPPVAEVESVKDQIRLAEEEGYKGTVHIVHVSVPESYAEIEKARERVDFRISCEVTPHHAILYDEMMKSENGLYLKMNPPLRPESMQDEILDLLLSGKINYIASDHAPHRLADKAGEKAASGIPGLPFLPEFVRYLEKHGMDRDDIDNLMHDNILDVFGIGSHHIMNSRRIYDNNTNLSGEYEFDAYECL